MTRWQRRTFLKALSGSSILPLAATATVNDPGLPLARIAEAIRTCAAEDVFAVAHGFYKRGATWSDLLAGVLLAGVRDINPIPVGFKLHAVMVVGAVYDLAENCPAKHRLLPVFYTLHDLKHAQQRDIALGDWVMPAAPRVRFSSRDEGLAAFEDAMARWHKADADRAITGLYPFLGREEFFNLLMPYTMRDFENLGHKPIYAEQARFALQRISWQDSLPVCRSLVQGMLMGGKETDLYHHNLELTERFRKGWANGGKDDDVSAQLLKRLRSEDSKSAGRTVLDLINDGVDPSSVWDGLRLFAAEQLYRRPGLLSVHPTTATNALFMAYEHAANDAHKRLCLVTAASWLPGFKQQLGARMGLSMNGPGLDSLRPSGDKGLSADRVYAANHTSEAQSAAMALLKDRNNLEAFEQRMRLQVFQKGSEYHHYKHTAAIIRESRACHPRWTPYLLASGLGYVPAGNQPDSDVYQKITRFLKSV